MKETIYFGTYTKHSSEGLYRANFNPETESLSDLQLVCANQNPTYLCLAEDKFISIGADVTASGIFLTNSQGEVLSTAYDDTANPCYVAYDSDKRMIYTANYHSRAISLYQIKGDYGLELLDRIYLEGSGPHPNQAQSHPHFSDLTPDQYLVTCDLGTDQLVTFEVCDQQLKEINRFKGRSGSGPRHLVFHPTEKIAYLVCELDSTVDVLFYDGYGAFELYKTYSTLPDGSDPKENATASIRITSDGRFLYISNRGHDSITVFAIQKDGDLIWLENVSSQGHIPRDFALSKSETHLIVGHQESDNISIFKRSEKNGTLSLVSNDFIVPEVVCVCSTL